ncbi:MAG: hypothetical protein MZV63_70015 [Marinilabiliales bacterium]|nr:hypothetical protein [Marinilabiliales bacterium]
MNSRVKISIKDMHYKIYHDEGVEEITLDYENADGRMEHAWTILPLTRQCKGGTYKSVVQAGW